VRINQKPNILTNTHCSIIFHVAFTILAKAKLHTHLISSLTTTIPQDTKATVETAPTIEILRTKAFQICCCCCSARSNAGTAVTTLETTRDKSFSDGDGTRLSTRKAIDSNHAVLPTLRVFREFFMFAFAK